jgi:hypothetical protein
MNGWLIIIIGLVFVGVGGFLGFYGAQLNNRADNEAAGKTLSDKIDGALVKMAKVQSTVATAPSQSDGTGASERNEIETIRQDFSEWASQFLQNRSAKKLELDRLKIQSKSEEIRISAMCRPIFQYAIEVLRGAVAAYNLRARTTYKISLKDLPDNLYDITGTNFDVGTIEFGSNQTWKINVTVYRPPRDNSPPVFFVIIPNAKQGEPDDSFRIEVGATTLVFQTGGGGIAGTANVDGAPAITDYEPAVRKAFERLLEAQITSHSPQN